MYYQKIGEGKPILFLHGWGCDSNIFLPVTKYLPNNSCYIVDFPGFGKSEKPSLTGWSIDDYVRCVVEFLQQHCLKNITIVAHSFGGRVAIVLSALYPSLVGKLLLVAPAGLRKFSVKRWWKVTRYKANKFLCRMGLSQNLSRFGSVDYNACDDGMKNTFVKVINQDLSKYAKLIKCHTLIVNGKKDNQTPLKHAKSLNKLIKNSSLVEAEGDHFELFSKPIVFAKIIEAFDE